MKQKVYDWLLRLVRYDEFGNKVVSHVNAFDMTKVQIMEVAEDYSKSFACVRVFKLEAIL